MQFKNATYLELKLSKCTNRCENELPSNELTTEIVYCLSEAANELQRLRSIIKEELKKEVDCFPTVPKVPWADLLYIGWIDSNKFWVRWTGQDGIYRWLHSLENRWIEEPNQKNMPYFNNYAEAQLAANNSPEPPTWQDNIIFAVPL